MRKVNFQDLGEIDYQEAWNHQEKLLSEILRIKSENRKKNIKHPTKNHLLFCCHPNVYTLGKSGKKANLLVGEKYLIEKGIAFYKTNRGGDITYHGPGQIVGYPILDLENFFTDINKYLRTLEEAVILTLKEYGLTGSRSKGETGVWIDAETDQARKICAIGVRVSRWVTMHGFAFNVNTDLSYFEKIIPCGITNKRVTSLENELSTKKSIEEAKEKLKTHLFRLFGMKT